MNNTWNGTAPHPHPNGAPVSPSAAVDIPDDNLLADAQLPDPVPASTGVPPREPPGRAPLPPSFQERILAVEEEAPAAEPYAPDTPAPAAAGYCLQQPVWFVGMGGTARWVLTYVKWLLLAIFGKVPDRVGLLAFDSGTEPVVVRLFGQRPVTLEPGVEYIQLDQVPLELIKRAPDYHASLFKRYGGQLARATQPSVYDGAGQWRLLGSLFVHYHAKTVRRHLHRVWRRMLRQPEGLEEEAQTLITPIIIVVGSMGGGQGSGGCLDLTLMIRDLLRQQAGLIHTSQVLGLFAPSSAFDDLKARGDGPNMDMNTFAEGRELNDLMSGRPLKLEYPDHTEVKSQEAPFDQVFLLEGIDERGRTRADRAGLFQMAARALTLLFTHDLGRSDHAFSLTHVGDGQASPLGFGPYCGTFGLHEIVYDGHQAASLGATRAALAMLEEALRPPSQGTSLVRLSPPTAAEAETQLLTESGVQIVPIRLPANLVQGDPALALGRLRDLTALGQRRQLRDAAYGQLTAAAQHLIQQGRANLLNDVRHLARSGSLPALLANLTASETALAEALAAIQASQTEVTALLSQKQDELARAEEEVKQAVNARIPWNRANALRRAALYYLGVAAERDQALLRRYLLQQLNEAFGQLRRLVLHLIERGERTQNRLRQVQERLRRAEARLVDFPSQPHATSILNERLIHALHEPLRPDAQATLSQAVGSLSLGLLSWADQEVDAVAQALLAVALPPYLPLADLSVEEILHRFWPQRSPANWLNRLIDRAAGAWNLNPAKTPPGHDPHESILIGVSNAAQSMFAGSGYTCISTGDPQRITLLRVLTHVPFDALQSFPLWEQSYRLQAPTAELSPHVFPEYFEEQQPADELFVLGRVFGWITENNRHYAYQPDLRVAPVYLAHGLDNAIAAITRPDGPRVDLIRRLNQERADQGLARFCAQIQSYLDEQSQPRTETTTRLLAAARAYLARLQEEKSYVR